MKSEFPHPIKIGNETSLISPLVERLLDEGESAGALDVEDRYKLMASLVEALTNAIIHGNLEVGSELRELENSEYQSVIDLRRRVSPYRERKVEIRRQFTRDRAIFQITDEGPGFDLASIPDPARNENLQRVSGRGIAIMHAFLDEVRFNQQGNSVTLIKYASCFPVSEDARFHIHAISPQREMK